MFNSAYVENAPEGGVAMLEVLGKDAQAMAFVPMRRIEISGEVTGMQVVAEVEALCLRTHTYFMHDSLKYLERGGRIGKAAAIAASILKIKPVLT